MCFTFSVSPPVSPINSHARTHSTSRSCLLFFDRQACFSVPISISSCVCVAVGPLMTMKLLTLGEGDGLLFLSVAFLSFFFAVHRPCQ